MSFKLTREQLYDLVWSEAMQKLSKQIGISDVGLAKTCRKVGIPIPERGYWNRLHAGKKVRKAPLPPRDLATLNHVEVSGTLVPELLNRFRGEPGVDAEIESIETLTERFKKRLGNVSALRNFKNVHPIIARYLAKDEEHRQKMLAERFYWRKPQFETPFERRRLCLLNSLLLGFAKVDCGGWVRGESAREHSIYIGNMSVEFTLDRVERTRNGRRSSSAAPGEEERLCLVLSQYEPPKDLRTSWEDEEGLPLERQITDVIVGMAIAAERFHRQWIERQIEWERQRREQAEIAARKRKEEEERREQERVAALKKAQIDNLVEEAERWRTAKYIREYVSAISEEVTDLEAPGLAAWRRWATTIAEEIDPIASGRAAETIRRLVPATGKE
jgi:hypothetical protein